MHTWNVVNDDECIECETLEEARALQATLPDHRIEDEYGNLLWDAEADPVQDDEADWEACMPTLMQRTDPDATLEPDDSDLVSLEEMERDEAVLESDARRIVGPDTPEMDAKDEISICPCCHGGGRVHSLPIANPAFSEVCWVCRGRGTVTKEEWHGYEIAPDRFRKEAP